MNQYQPVLFLIGLVILVFLRIFSASYGASWNSADTSSAQSTDPPITTQISLEPSSEIPLAEKQEGYHLPSSQILYVSCPSYEVAKSLSRGILGQKLVASVNIFPKVTSFYWSDGKIQENDEVMLLLKTETALVQNITDFLAKEHPYKVPEVISIQIQGGNKEYLDWIHKSIQPDLIEEQKDDA